MIEIVLYLSVAINVALMISIFALNRRLTKVEQPQANPLEVKYFEYIEENSGALKNSRKYVVKGQIHFHGLPVGIQFVVSEQIIEEFSWEKFAKIRTEVLLPMAHLGVEMGMAIKSAGGSAVGALDTAIKAIKQKAG